MLFKLFNCLIAIEFDKNCTLIEFDFNINTKCFLNSLEKEVISDFC